MSRGPHSFTESDIVRAYRSARKAGVENPIIEIDRSRNRLRIIPRDAATPNLTPEDELERWRKQKNAG